MISLRDAILHYEPFGFMLVVDFDHVALAKGWRRTSNSSSALYLLNITYF